jgi:hypothetical protein
MRIRSWVEVMHDFMNAQRWFQFKEEDRMASKECPKLGFVDADFQDCDKCGMCLEVKK